MFYNARTPNQLNGLLLLQTQEDNDISFLLLLEDSETEKLSVGNAIT